MWILFALATAAAGGQNAPDRTGLLSMFQLMDRNGDGYITTNEAPRVTRVRAASVQTGASHPSTGWIEDYDRDGDGRVSQAEFVSSAEDEAVRDGR
jgi:Ca2+-binding EF-hand superfamily protein